jgi:thiol-disulfide isomerase/thioredoxin
MTLNDLAYTDVGETLDDMRLRAAYNHLEYPYLSDGESQTLTKQFRVVTTPHIFVFDRERRLQYQGRLEEAPSAVETLLSGKPVRSTRTPVAGCTVKGLGAPERDERLAAVEAAPVTVEGIDASGLKRLRQNGTGKLLLVNFWATWCAPCVSEFPDLEMTYRMYKGRNVEFVTVSVNDPAERPAVIEFLRQHHASHPNWQFATSDVYGLQEAFDPKLPAPVPLTLLLAPNGDVLYQELGASDIPRLRRAILANLPDDPQYPGSQAYWRSGRFEEKQK